MWRCLAALEDPDVLKKHRTDSPSRVDLQRTTFLLHVGNRQSHTETPESSDGKMGMTRCTHNTGEKKAYEIIHPKASNDEASYETQAQTGK